MSKMSWLLYGGDDNFNIKGVLRLTLLPFSGRIISMEKSEEKGKGKASEVTHNVK